MPKYNNYTEFEKAVFTEVQKQVNGNTSPVAAAVVGAMGGAGIFGCLVGHIGSGMHSMMSLNEMYYQSYIRSEYQQEFEQHKNNTQYIDSLITRVAAKIIKQLEND